MQSLSLSRSLHLEFCLAGTQYLKIALLLSKFAYIEVASTHLQEEFCGKKTEKSIVSLPANCYLSQPSNKSYLWMSLRPLWPHTRHRQSVRTTLIPWMFEGQMEDAAPNCTLVERVITCLGPYFRLLKARSCSTPSQFIHQGLRDSPSSRCQATGKESHHEHTISPDLLG